MQFHQIVDEAKLDELLAQVDGARLMRSVEAIAQNVRLSGTPEEAEAFDYLQTELEALGLDVRRFTRPGYVSLPRAASLAIGDAHIHCVAHSMTASVSERAAALVYLSADQIAAAPPAQLAGKFLLTDGLAMFPIVQAAEQRGASGVVFITGKCIHEMIVSSVWGNPTPTDLDAYTRLPVVSVNAQDGALLKQQLAQEALEAVLSTRVDTGWTDLTILTADLAGAEEESYLLLSGHVDSWHRGALDNASGNAAALEIARLLVQMKGALRRGIKFAFWSGHSHGRYAGSTAFCDACFTDLSERCFLHVNADCLGGQNATVLTQSACMPETKALGAAALEKIAGQTLEGVPFSRSSDQSFWGTGTPSLFAGVSEQPPLTGGDAASRAFAQLFGGNKSGGFGWWWHTVADTPDKLDAANLVRDCRIYLAALYAACAAPYLPLALDAAAREIRKALESYVRAAGDALDLAPLLDDARALTDNVALAESKKRAGNAPPAAYNRFALQLEQCLVPLAWVKGSRFTHDSVRRQPLLPLLEDCLALPAEQDVQRRNALLVALQRRCNEAHAALRAANTLALRFLRSCAPD